MSIKKKDKDWFQKVFDDNYDHLRNFIYYLSGDLTLTDDLVQDAFMQLWEERYSIKDVTLKAYLFTIAKNLYFKHHRKKNIILNFKNSLITEQENESPEYLMEMKEFDKQLQTVIAALPDKTRAIFLMSRIDKMTYTEIANNLDLSVKAVEKHMSKALKYIRQKLDKQL